MSHDHKTSTLSFKVVHLHKKILFELIIILDLETLNTAGTLIHPEDLKVM